jgi:hypothetical protein
MIFPFKFLMSLLPKSLPLNHRIRFQASVA